MCASAAAAAPTILLTADTEGAADTLARRGTVVAKARKDAPGALLVDAGNALFGQGSAAARGKNVAAGYAALAYDAVNLSARDFRYGKDHTLALVKEAKLEAVSANLLDEASGAPLVKPYVVKEAGGQKVAILGLADAPVGLDRLPALKQQLAGVKFAPPAEALAQWLPKAKAEAGVVVLLYHGSAGNLAAIREKFGGELAAILVGNLRPEQLPPAGGKPALAGAGPRGLDVTRVVLGDKPEVKRLAVEEDAKPDAAVALALANYETPIVPNAGPAKVDTPAAADKLEVGKTYRLNLTASNRGAKLNVLSAQVVESYGQTAAPAGRRWLVLDTEWENAIPLTAVNEKQVSTAYKLPGLDNLIYVIVNGARLARIPAAQAKGWAGHLPVAEFTLEEIGQKKRGDLVFEVPNDDVTRLDLRFFDSSHGSIALVLKPAPAGAPEVKPVAGPLKNDVVEAAVFGVRKEKKLGERTAPEGQTFVLADLRARSLVLLPPPAGGRGLLPTVADWRESRKYTHLVLDGEFAYPPLAESQLPAEPRLIPEVMTGGELAFLVPEAAKVIELRCDFPNAAIPGKPQVTRPAGLVMTLEGERPGRLPELPTIVEVKDDVYKVGVTAQNAPREFAGAKADAGQRFLVLDVTVANGGRAGEFFQTKQQLKFVAASGAQAEVDPVTFAGPRRPAELVWIPAGERRSFQVVFRVAEAEKRPRLAFAGVTLAKVYDLKPLDGALVGGIALDAPATKPAKVEVVVRVEKPQAGPDERPVVHEPRRPAKPLVPVPARQPGRAPRGIAGVGLTAEQVNRSIDAGADYLWHFLQATDLKDRGLLGSQAEHELCALALVHAGYHKRNPQFDAALRKFLAGDLEPGRLGTYRAGIVCMLIEAYGDTSYEPLLRKVSRYLLEGQGVDGSWGYNGRVPVELFKDPEHELVLRADGGTPPDGGEVWKRLTPWNKENEGDNSVSQYALLGLHAASRSGIKLPPETWKRALDVTRARENTKDGGWAYHQLSTSYGSMTAAGVCAVALARHELGEKGPWVDPAIERGLGWLAAQFTVTENPPDQSWHYYYLYSVERVGRILDTEFIGPHEWYPAGARFLVDAQKADGGWIGKSQESDPRLATSFSLLFLTRATPSLQVTPKRGGDGLLKTAVIAPPARVYIILDCSGSMLEQMNGRDKFDVARDAVTKLVAEIPDAAHVALRVYGHRKRALDAGADQDVEVLVPMGKLDRKTFNAKLQALRAKGKTPLAQSLRESIADLKGGTAEDPITVILLTDGGEDTRPRQDPLKSADEFAKLKGARLHVVGFDVENRPDWTEQLVQIAARAGGQYVPAAQGDALLRGLRSAAFGTPDEFTLIAADGRAIAREPFGASKKLPEGQYRLQAAYAGTTFERQFWVNTEGTTVVTFDARNVAAAKAKGTQVAKGAVTGVPAATRPAAVIERPTTPEVKSKFCTECGKPLKAGAKFCTECGAKAPG